MEALADGIFAFSMTLLVLGIDVPKSIPKADADQALLQHLIDLVPQFLIYLLAFFILGAFWYGHQQQLRFLRRVNGRLLASNIFIMMIVALVPFTTNLAGDYGSHQMGILPLEVNLLLLALIFYIQWSYITAHPELMNQMLDSKTTAEIKERNLIMVVLSLLAIVLSFFIPSWSTTPYLLDPLLHLSARYRQRN